VYNRQEIFQVAKMTRRKTDRKDPTARSLLIGPEEMFRRNLAII
jgi:hypothetical protein